jgi:hypothetical protein
MSPSGERGTSGITSFVQQSHGNASVAMRQRCIFLVYLALLHKPFSRFHCAYNPKDAAQDRSERKL